MTLIYDTLSNIVNKIKKILILLVSIVIVLALACPYAISFYVEQKYRALTKAIVALNPEIVITNNVQRKYLSSKIITKVQLTKNIFFDEQSGIIERNLPKTNMSNKILLILQQDVKHLPFNKILNKDRLIAEIHTKMIAGFPAFFQQEQPEFSLTTIDFKGNVKTTVNAINLDYVLNLDEDYSLQAKQIAMRIENDNKDFKVNLEIPKLVYVESNKKAEIDDVQFNIKINDFKSANNRNIQLLTEIERIYFVDKSTPVLRLVNFSMSQDLSKINTEKSTLNNSVSFARLNVFEQKFGPLVTKWQINNIHLPTIMENFNNFKLPITMEQVTAYKFMEMGNRLLKYQPNVTVDVLLNTGSGKLKLLSDFTANPKEADWFTMEDILDSLQANVAAHMPKKIFFEIVTLVLQEKLKKESVIEPVYKNNHKHGHNMPNAIALQDPKEFQKQLESMVIERVNYLLKHNVINEQENSFVLDLSIAEGTFYSRMNPFKLFSF
jgi:hypothetical protein